MAGPQWLDAVKRVLVECQTLVHSCHKDDNGDKVCTATEIPTTCSPFRMQAHLECVMTEGAAVSCCAFTRLHKIPEAARQSIQVNRACDVRSMRRHCHLRQECREQRAVHKVSTAPDKKQHGPALSQNDQRQNFCIPFSNSCRMWACEPKGGDAGLPPLLHVSTDSASSCDDQPSGKP